MTRKELLGSLASNGVIIANPVFENEELALLEEVVTDMVYFNEDEDEEDETEVSVEEQELCGRSEGDTEVVHILYPGVEHYATLMDWAERMKNEYEAVNLKYVEEDDAFIFYAGNEDEAVSIAKDLIEDIEYQ